MNPPHRENIRLMQAMSVVRAADARIRGWLVAGLVALGFSLVAGWVPDAFARQPDSAGREPLRVVATFSILGDMVREVGGTDVQVDTLVGRNADAHEFEPSPADVRKLAAAQLVVANGLGFEPWLARLQQAAGYKGVTVLASAGVPTRRFTELGACAAPARRHDRAPACHDHGGHQHGDNHQDAHDHDHDHDHDHAPGEGSKAGHTEPVDPHAWQSLPNAIIYVRNIAAALAQADPARAEVYQRRAADYTGRIKAMDARVRAAFAALPPERRRAVIAHDAFGYFGETYGITFIPAKGVSTAAEPSAAGVAAIIAQVRRDAVPALFVENIGNARLIEQIARETGARVGGRLYTDALAPVGQPADNYLSMFQHNVDAFMSALATAGKP